MVATRSYWFVINPLTGGLGGKAGLSELVVVAHLLVSLYLTCLQKTQMASSARCFPFKGKACNQTAVSDCPQDGTQWSAALLAVNPRDDGGHACPMMERVDEDGTVCNWWRATCMESTSFS